MLFDRVQIGEVIHRYPVSIDSRDWKLFRSIFTDEIQVYLGPPTDKLNLRTVRADKFTEQVTGVLDTKFGLNLHGGAADAGARAILEAMRRHGVDHYCGAPIVHNMLINAEPAWRAGITRRVRGMVAGAARSGWP